MLADRYELDHEIGRGGMGSVWLARDTVLDRTVAVKQIGMAHTGAEPDLERATREAHLAASINHQNVVGVYDLVDDGGHQWLVMEHVDGPTLAGVIAEHGRVDPGELAPIVQQVAGALAVAHEHGIVHRDVKPSNILLTGDGIAKLSDFGVARAQADASLTQTGLVTGSPAYLSPEVASGRTATSASDVWSLGATVFHALAGRPPYEAADNVLGAMYRIVHEEPPRLDAHGTLPDLVTAMMQHDPAARPTMAEVARTLSAQSDDAPEITQAMLATPAADETGPLPAPAPTTAFRPLQPPVAPAPPTPRAGSHARSASGRGIAAVVVAVAAVAAIGFVALRGGDDTEPAPPAAADTGRAPAEAEPAPAGGATASALEGFAADYLSTASNDPDRGFAMLTPAYQRESDGIKGYKGFWSHVDNLDVEQISADPEAMRVSYTYSYDFKGTRRSESVTLQLESAEDSFLIAGAV